MSYDTLHECCDVSFSWVYDACMTNGNDDNNNDNDVEGRGELNLLDVLPMEFEAMIELASATSSMPSAAPIMMSMTSGYYFPSYDTDGGKSRSVKSISEFNSWEVQYNTLHGCCRESIGWDYNACMNTGNAMRMV